MAKKISNGPGILQAKLDTGQSRFCVVFFSCLTKKTSKNTESW